MSSGLRTKDRVRRLLLSAGTSALSRAIAFAGSLVTIPAALNHLGPDRFGLWMLIISLQITLNFADLGIGNGLITAVADANARGDRAKITRSISSAVAVLLAVAVGGGIVFFGVHSRVKWGHVLNAATPSGIAEADMAVLILAISLLAGIPLSLAQKVHLGLQEAFVAHLWSALGSLLAVGGVILAVVTKASLPWLVLAAVAGPVFAAVLNWIYLFHVRHPELMPRILSVTKEGAITASRRGATFLVLGVSGSIAYQADHIIITRILGADAVSEYAVPLKLFFVAPTLLGFVLAPLWPTYSEALVTGDVHWLKTALWRSAIAGAGFTAAFSVPLVLFGAEIIRFWVGNAIEPSTPLLLGMSLWAVVNGVGGPIAMFLNGIDQLRFLVVVTIMMAVSNLLLSIYLTRRIGVAGPVYASVATQVVIVLVPSVLFINRIWSRISPATGIVETPSPAEEISTREYRLNQ